MKVFLSTAFRTILTFGGLCIAQYLIPYYLIATAAIVAGIFMLNTSDDRPTALGILIGGIFFGVFAYLMSVYFPIIG